MKTTANTVVKEALYVWTLLAIVTALTACKGSETQGVDSSFAGPVVENNDGGTNPNIAEPDNTNPDVVSENPQVGDDDVSADEQLSFEIEASRTYSPSKWQNGYTQVDSTINITIPAYLQVTQGNAGNHKAWVNFGEMSCMYRGGASRSKPKDEEDVQKGLKYHFYVCLDRDGNTLNLSENSTIAFSGLIELSVDNGDGSRGQTKVKAVFNVVKN